MCRARGPRGLELRITDCNQTVGASQSSALCSIQGTDREADILKLKFSCYKKKIPA